MKRIVLIVGIVIAVLLVAVISLPFLVNANQFRPMLETKLAAALGRRVGVGDLKLSLFSGAVSAGDLAVADDPAYSASPFLQAKALSVNVDMGQLIFSRKLNVTGLTIDQPKIVLLQNAAGAWNFSTLGTQAAKRPAAPTPEASGDKNSMNMSVQLIRITGGTFSVGKTGGREKPMTLENVNVEVRDFSAASAFPFTFSAKVASGGEIRLNGKAGPLDATDASMTPATVTLDVTGLDISKLAFAGPSTGLAGMVSFHGTAQSAAAHVKLDAKLRADKLKMAKNGTPCRRPVELDVSVRHDLHKNSGSLDKGDIHIGAALASLTGTYAERGDTTTLNMKFSGPKMSVPELAELLPPLGIGLPNGSSLQGGTATAAFTVEGPTDKLVTVGSLSLDHTRLAGFDLGSKIGTVAALAGIKAGPDTDIDTFAAGVKMTPEGTAVSGIRFLAPAIGEVTGDGAVSPANALDFKMQATVHTAGVAAALSRTAVPFLVQGTAANPSFKPDVKELVKQNKEQLQGAASKAASGLLNRLLKKDK